MYDSWALAIFFFVTSYGAVQFYEITEGRVRANMAGFFVLLALRSTLMGTAIIVVSMILTAFTQSPQPGYLAGGATALLGMTVVRHLFSKPKTPDA